MRVAIVINSKAGSVDESLVRQKIEEALFRCELSFFVPTSIAEMDAFAASEISRANYFLICGGDGTINVTLQSLLRQSTEHPLPPICLVRSGTANDLAGEIGVSRKIGQAARSILEGRIKHIDLIELESDCGQKAVMLTNGGVGIPALTADAANRIRHLLREKSTETQGLGALKMFSRHSYNALKKAGSGVYLMMVAEALRQWRPDDWEVEIDLPGRESFVTKASSILVNNQPRMGQSMTPAPFTSNNDGLVNLLVTEAHTISDQLRAVVSFRQGKPEELPMNRSFEVAMLKMRSRQGRRPLTFFGDGEILLKDVREITVRCRHRGIPVVVRA